MKSEQLLVEVCAQVGIGVRSVQGVQRDADTVRRRAVVVRILSRQAGLTQAEIAVLISKSARTVERMLRK